MWLKNTDCFCFPCAAYELRRSSDLSLLTKWPVFLHNAFGNPAYVNQTNLNAKLRKTLGGQTGDQAKIWGSMAHLGHPLDLPPAILHANNPLKNVSSKFVLLCKKAAPLHFIQATPQLVLSALLGNFANKVARFSDSRIVSHPIAKSHVKPWSVREHDAA